ncbi:MAG: glycosyltransferase [Prevotella sp.]|nr:glycosyltransferase [Prevotella sp.]
MRILQLGKFYPVQGGVEKVMYDLLVGLSEKGIPCDMLCAHVETGKEELIEVTPQNKVICVKTLVKKYATMISPQMITMLRRIAPQYDIIHVHHPDPMAALALWLSGYKGKVVLHWHSDIVKQKFLLSLYQPLQNWLIRRADLVVGTTPVYIAQSPCLAGVQQKCTYLPIGIEPIVPDAAAVERIRQQYEGKKIIFSLGRLVHYKGYRYLVDAARYLDDNYVVLIGGSGELHDELQAQINRHNLNDRVKLLGRVSGDDLAAYYGACDVYCLSSVMKTEAFAIVQIEAMSCGKPVVCCNIKGSGVPWVNRDGESGLVVEPESAEALADAIRRLTDDSALYQQLSAGAKSRYEQLFRKEKMISRCCELYQQLLH